MKIISIKGTTARCFRQGIERDVDIFLIADQSLKPDDFVLVHVGYAIQKVENNDAKSRWQLIDEMLSITD